MARKKPSAEAEGFFICHKRIRFFKIIESFYDKRNNEDCSPTNRGRAEDTPSADAEGFFIAHGQGNCPWKLLGATVLPRGVVLLGSSPVLGLKTDQKLTNQTRGGCIWSKFMSFF